MQSESRILAVIPFIDLWPLTQRAAQDALDQSLKPDLLLIDNASEDPSPPADYVRYEQEELSAEVLLWRHAPPLPTLCATWNEAFRYARRAGYRAVWMLNNDLELHPRTLEFLDAAMKASSALFVSAVGVQESDWRKGYDIAQAVHKSGKGGPDYSCFLFSVEGWERFPFDEAFTYCGDLDHHRRIMLAGEGDQIFSLNVPYLHFGSATIKHRPELEAVADAHRALYAQKWGGGPTAETWTEPFAGAPPHDGACTTTQGLQQHRCAGFHRGDGTLLGPDELADAIHRREDAAAEVSSLSVRAP